MQIPGGSESVYLSADLRARLYKEIGKEGLSKNAIIRTALQEFLNRKTKIRKLRKK